MTTYNNPCTTDLARFGARERHELSKILQAWEGHGLPDGFDTSEVTPMLNIMSGCVFLTNAEAQAALINPHTGRLEEFIWTPYDGHEGFLSDLIDWLTPATCNAEDAAYIRELATARGVPLTGAWAEDAEGEDE